MKRVEYESNSSGKLTLSTLKWAVVCNFYWFGIFKEIWKHLCTIFYHLLRALFQQNRQNQWHNSESVLIRALPCLCSAANIWAKLFKMDVSIFWDVHNLLNYLQTIYCADYRSLFFCSFIYLSFYSLLWRHTVYPGRAVNQRIEILNPFWPKWEGV